MSRQRLAEATDVLQRFNDANQQDTYSRRGNIFSLLDTFYYDLDTVASSLRQLGKESEYCTLLKLPHSSIIHQLEVYLQTRPAGAPRNPKPSPEERQTHAFTGWFVRMLLRLCTSEGCKELHEQCCNLMTLLIGAMMPKSPYVFRSFTEEFILTLADLTVTRREEKTNVEVKHFPVVSDLILQSIKDPQSESPPNVVIRDYPFVTTDLESCDLLILNITQVLWKLAEKVCSVQSPDFTEKLFTTLSLQVELCEPKVKVVSLNLLRKMLLHKGLPSEEIMDYFVCLLPALIKVILKQNQWIEDDDVQLELSTAQILDAVVTADKRSLNYRQSLTQQQRKTFLELTHQNLVEEGIVNIKSKTARGVRGAISRILQYMIQGLDAWRRDISYKPARIDLGKELIKPVGVLPDLEYLVPMLSYMVSIELEEKTKAEAAGMSGKGKLKKLKAKKPSAAEEGKRRLTHAYLMLAVQVDSAGNSKEVTDGGLSNLAAAWLLMEVSARSVIKPGSSQVTGSISELAISAAEFKLMLTIWWTWLQTASGLKDLPIVESMEGDHDHEITESQLQRGYCLLLDAMGAMACVADHMCDYPNLWNDTTALCSLPWLRREENWHDLSREREEVYAALGSTIGPRIEPEGRARCLEVLALLPSNVNCLWRCQVFTKALTDNSAVVRAAAVKAFPLLMFRLGASAYGLISASLKPVMEDPDPSVVEALAESMQYLACVTSGQAALCWGKVLEDMAPLHKTVFLQCAACGDLRAIENRSAVAKRQPAVKLSNNALLSDFLPLLQSQHDKVKKAMVKSMWSLLGHLDVATDSASSAYILETCLSMAETPQFFQRMQIGQALQRLVEAKPGCLTAPTPEVERVLSSRLLALARQASTCSNIHLQETAMFSLGQVARVAEGELLMQCLWGLLEGVLSGVPTVHSMAFLQIREISKTKNMTTVQQFFKKHRENICKMLVEILLDEKQQLGPEKIIENVCGAFGMTDPKTFLQSCEKYMVPLLVSKGTPQASNIIRAMASMQKLPNRKKMLIHNTKYIFSYLVRECPKDMARCIQYLQAETGFELGNLLRMDFERVHNELLLHLSQNYSQVFNGLKTLASYDEQGPWDTDTPEQMASYLEPRLLGVLAFFDSQLMNSSVDYRDQQMALSSLISIMQLMGPKYITSIRHKVFKTLSLGLQFKDPTTMEISCRAWSCFVHSLEVPWLGVMLSQIAATLLPLLEKVPSSVADIFHYMVIESREALQSHFTELYFLPEIPELADVLAVLKECSSAPSSQADLNTRLTQAIEGLKHESQDVRLHALSRLCKLLRKEKTEILKEILAEDTSPPVISELVKVLLEGCRESDSKVRCLYAECFGELGAIDPGRLELLSTQPKEEGFGSKASLEDEAFIVGLISEVVKAFLSATEPRIQDCAAFALQDLLRIYNIRGEGEAGLPTSTLWQCFPEQVQEVLIPLLSSKYVLTALGLPSNLSKPIFGSSHGKSFKSWVSLWASYLITKVKQDRPFWVFQACCATLRHSVPVALYLLPYIIVQVLQDGSEDDVKEVVAEVMEVLGAVHKPETRHGSALDFRHMSAQTIFSVMDHLIKWRFDRISTCASESNNPREAAYLKDPGYLAVHRFLQQIPLDMMAEVSHNCKALTRSLTHLDEHIMNNPSTLQNHLDLFQRLYVDLDEVDGVLGVAAVRKSRATLQQQILTLESLGRHQDALACYEKAIQQEGSEVKLHCGLLRSLLELGQLTQVTSHAAGVIAEKPVWSPELNKYRVEAAWRLCSWDKLDNYVALEKNSNSWPVRVGQLLLTAKERNEEGFLERLRTTRLELMGPLSAASLESGSYYRGYEHILRLQLLTEMELGLAALADFPAPAVESSQDARPPRPAELLAQWDLGLHATQASLRVQEPILALRRTLLSLVNPATHPELPTAIDQWWLNSAKLARKAGYMQTAHTCLIQASDSQLPQYCLEKAKWLWARGMKEEAVTCLREGTQEHFGNGSSITSDKSEANAPLRHVYAQSLQLLGRYCEEVSNMESTSIVKLYKDAIEASPTWEDSHFYLAKYYDKLMTALIEDKMPEKQGEFIYQVVLFFGTSLKYGNAFIYQSMPRMLSLWLDYGTHVVELEKDPRRRRSPNLAAQQQTLQKLNRLMASFIKDLAPYQFLTAMSQLVSRLCHAHAEVFERLQDLLATLLVTFPQQAAWNMIAVSKSSYAMRVTRCQQIFAAAKARNSRLNMFLQDITLLVDKLLELANKTLTDNAPLSVSKHFKGLRRLFEDPNFSKIILPLQSTMTVSLPSTVESKTEYKPFPHSQVYIKGIQDTIEVLPSLQKPRKITLQGSDGRFYIMLCKPKDDLRKDCRLMEFNNIVNKFLRRDPESSRRNLLIRTYSVVPLNEECGLLEWVNNTQGLRNILMRLYKEHGYFTTGKELKALMAPVNAKLEIKLRIFQKEFLPRFPPILQEWHRRTFPNPNSWYNARLAYARTMAVMSMVGYILGLGDRHGENILFDSTNGDVVHVDFNCLFNRGETFEYPEVVPFRLTQNLVQALGPLKWEGVFRRACEVCMRVMRTRMDPLMSVLRPFIYDPLLEWGKSKAHKSAPTVSGEITNEQAMTHVQNIEHRLQGILKTKAKPRGLPLSIEGHVEHLIQEATDPQNLCQMYIGWAAYM